MLTGILCVLYIPQGIESCARLRTYSRPLSEFRWQLCYGGDMMDRDRLSSGDYVLVQFIEPYASHYNIPPDKLFCSYINFDSIGRPITETLIPDTFALAWYDYRADMFREAKIPLSELKLGIKDMPVKPHDSYGAEIDPYLKLEIQSDGSINYYLIDNYIHNKIAVFSSQEVGMDWKTTMPDNGYGSQQWRDIVLLTYPWDIEAVMPDSTRVNGVRRFSSDVRSVSGVRYIFGTPWTNNKGWEAKSIPQYIIIKERGIAITLDIEEVVDAFDTIYTDYEGSGDDLPESTFRIYMPQDSIAKVYLKEDNTNIGLALHKITVHDIKAD